MNAYIRDFRGYDHHRCGHNHGHRHHGHHGHNGQDINIFVNYGRPMTPYGRPYGPQPFYGNPYGPRPFFPRPFGMIAAGLGIGALAYSASKGGSFFQKLGNFFGSLFGKKSEEAPKNTTGDVQTQKTTTLV